MIYDFRSKQQIDTNKNSNQISLLVYYESSRNLIIKKLRKLCIIDHMLHETYT